MLPQIEFIQHYSYVASRPRGKQGPMHPQRIKEYDEEIEMIATTFDTDFHSYPARQNTTLN